jgi:tRNA 2-selenouridine synthase
MTGLPFHRDRNLASVGTPLSLAGIEAFDAVIDARSPAEYAEDRLPGAINCPVLDDAERALVGTVYKQQSSFEAKRLGAPLAAKNIARHIEERFAGKPRAWRPLVYCWRGGGRSGAFVHVLRQVGWDARQLEGGYKAFRRQVAADLGTLPERFTFQVIAGPTGTGKSRLLEALAESGAQVLDLEQLAAHRGSVLGDLPGEPQPPQKTFETRIWERLSRFDASRPVHVESESKRVGKLRVPEFLIERMRQGACFAIDLDPAGRVAPLIEEYAHLIANPSLLAARLDLLSGLHPKERIDRWQGQVAAGQWPELVASLLEEHYDPAYRKSMFRNYRQAAAATPVAVQDFGRAGFLDAARRLLAMPVP